MWENGAMASRVLNVIIYKKMYGKLQATISTSDLQIQSQQLKTVRKINKYKIPDFLTNLSYKTWDITFNSIDVNIMFNSFLNTRLRIYLLSNVIACY